MLPKEVDRNIFDVIYSIWYSNLSEIKSRVFRS